LTPAGGGAQATPGAAPGQQPAGGSYPGAEPAVGWEPPPAVYQQYATGPAPGSDRSPEGLRILAIVVSVVKAIPLVLGLIALIFIVGVADDINEIDGLDVFDGALLAIVLVFLLFIGLGALLLFFQLRTVMKSQMLGLAVVAGIMAAIDLLFLLGSLGGDDSSAGGILLMLVVFAAQATVFGWAIKARKGTSL